MNLQKSVVHDVTRLTWLSCFCLCSQIEHFLWKKLH